MYEQRQIDALRAVRQGQLDVGGPVPVSHALPYFEPGGTPQGLGQTLRRAEEDGLVQRTTLGWRLTRSGANRARSKR